MTLYLLRHYWKPNFIMRENQLWLVFGMLLPAMVLMAWGFPGTGGIWTAASMSALVGALVPQRPTRFEGALPISGRDIAAARLFSALAISIAPILLATAAVVAFQHTAFPAFELAAASSIAALAVLLPRLVRMNELTIPPGSGLTTVMAMGVAAGVAIFNLSHVQSLALLLVSVIAAGTWWWNRVPHAFQLAPLSASSLAEQVAGAPVSEITKRVPWWLVIRTTILSKNRFVLGLMMLLGGATGMWQLYLFSMVVIEDVWQRARWMQPMPLSHRARLWMTLAPGVMLPSILTIIGLQIHLPGRDYMQSVHRSAIDTYKQEARYFDSPTSVSLDYWERAAGDVPVIRAPWGETVLPYVVHVFHRTYYNPYTARKASSERFTSWQFERLTTAVFGVPLPLKDHDDGQRNPRRLNAAPRMMILNIGASLTLAFLFLFGYGFVRWHKAWAHQTLVGILLALLMLLPAGVWLFSIFVYGFGQGAMNVVVPLFERQLMNLSHWLPSNNFVVLATAAVPVLSMYALLEWQFRSSEIVGPVPKL